MQRSKLQGKTRIAQATDKMRFMFENRVVVSQSKEEIISQFHPLIRYISEYYKSKGVRKYFSVIASELSGVDLPNISPGVYVFAVERWSVKVALRDIEQLSYKVLTLEGNELDADGSELIVNTATHNGQDWLSAGNEVDGVKAEELFSKCIDSLEYKYQMYIGSMTRENCDRLNFQRTNIELQFARKEREWIELINRMRNEKKERGARLQEAKLNKHRARAEEILLSIRKSENPVHEKILVSSGLICVK